MKKTYLKGFLFFGVLLVLIGLGSGHPWMSAKASADVAPWNPENRTFYRVYFENPDTAANIVISMNAVETKYEKGYIIVEVSGPGEYGQLVGTGLEFEEITDPLADKIALIRESAKAEVEGIPAYPCYRTVEETFATAAAIASTNPTLATWTDYGDSWEKTNGFGGYDMNVLKLTNSAVGGDKPKLFLTGAIHAREYTTAELVTRFAEYLVDNYGIDADATWLLDHHELHLMLQANPDGRKQAEAGWSWRKNTNQDYCGPTSSSRGADLNRNFPFKWDCCGGSSSSECSTTFHGAGPASEPETQAVRDYMMSIFPDQRGPNDSDAAPLDATGVYLDIHASGRLILWPWGWTPDPAPNAAGLATLGRKMGYFNGHTPKQGYGLYPTDGTTKLFGYGELGIPAYTVELGTQFFESCSYFENTLVPDNMPALLYTLKIVRTPYMTPSGPDSTNLSLDAVSVPAGTPVTLSALVDDSRYNNSNGTEPSQDIAAAEYYVDTPPWVTSPTPVAYALSAVDGTFNNPQEDVQGVIDTTGWSSGQHIIFVRGRDADGNWGAFSAIFLEVGGTPDTDPPAPDPMTWAVLPYASGADSISMTATTASDPSGVEYYFECLTVGGNDSGWQDSPAYEDTGLAGGATYTYRVKARDKSVNHNETAFSTQQSVALAAIPPTAPGNLKAKGSKYSVKLTWNDNSGDEDGFRIYRGASAGSLSLVGTVGAGTTLFQDTGLTRKTFYYYKVCAYNGGGEGCTAVLQTKTK